MSSRLVIAWFFTVTIVNGMQPKQCGPPGRPANGSIPSGPSLYYPGEEVRYKCDRSFVLVGNEVRRCRDDGTWTGRTPRCELNVAKEKEARQSATLWSYAADLAVDGNPESCSFTPRSIESRWWQVDLGRVYDVEAVAVTISQGTYQEFTVFVLQVISESELQYSPCASFRGHFRQARVQFSCGGVASAAQPLAGRYLYLRDDRKVQEYFGLCEVEVFARRAAIECGDPEEPLYGTAHRVNANMVQYACATGFRMEGSVNRYCQPDGYWSGSAPVCIEVTCNSPPAIPHASVTVTITSEDYVFDSVAVYTCEPGHVMWGNATRVCGQTGDWSGDLPECKAIACGRPPEVPNGRVELLNGTVTWNSHAAYHCQDGYVLHSHMTEVRSYCQDDGTWSPVNLTCIYDSTAGHPVKVQQFPGAGSVAGTSWGNPIDASSASPSPTTTPQRMHMGGVAALGAIAAVIMVIMIAVGVVFARRRAKSWKSGSSGNKSPQASLNHLVSENIYDDVSTFASDSSLTKNNLVLNGTEEVHYTRIGSGTNTFRVDSGGYEAVMPDTESWYETLRGPGKTDRPVAVAIGGTAEPNAKYPSEPGVKYATVQTHSKRLVPDILKNVKSGSVTPPVTVTPPSPGRSQAPPEIMALYAQVDKSKKRRYREDGDAASGDTPHRPLPPVPPPKPPHANANTDHQCI